MNRRRFRNAVGAAGPLLLVLGLFIDRPDAAHYAWLGHTACPWDPASCERQVPAGFKPLGDFDHGVYRTLDESSAEWRGENRTEPLRTREGHVIAHVGARFRRQLDVEGSGRLRDGRVVTIEGTFAGQSSFLLIENSPFGVGAPGYKLVPWRTVSVHPKRIALGTVLFIPALVGVRLPSGELHARRCRREHRDLCRVQSRSGPYRPGARDEAAVERLSGRFGSLRGAESSLQGSVRMERVRGRRCALDLNPLDPGPLNRRDQRSPRNVQ